MPALVQQPTAAVEWGWGEGGVIEEKSYSAHNIKTDPEIITQLEKGRSGTVAEEDKSLAFTREEVEETIRSMTNGKATGLAIYLQNY